MYPTAAALGHDLVLLQEMYDAGQYVSAWQHAQRLPPMTEWRGSAACTFAARLYANLGASRKSEFFHARAWRADRSDPLTAYFRAASIAGRLGPLRALRFLDKLPPFADADLDTRVSLIALRFRLFAAFRDISRVEKLWEEAVALSPDHPWIWVERARALECFDAYPEALAAAQHALQQRPNYRPAVQAAAHLLGLVGRDAEAMELLRSASGVLQSASVVAQLAALLVEHDRHEEGLAEWKRYRELAVLIEPEGIAWWHSRMSDALYELGHISEAGEHAKLSKNGFHEQIAERLLHPPAEAKSVRLSVPFVRQHDMTCAPATLSALSRYWKTPVDHLELAREICYDGTQPFRERQWADQNGFLTREFTVTWDAAVALLDRGIPFALGTVETRSAHLQAIMGYDGVRGTLVLRDPYLKHPGEVIGPKWLDSYASSGPRGLVIMPKSEAARLDGITLPDAELYDHLHQLTSALNAHDREAAQRALTALEQADPEHRITWDARREIAWYDSNQPQALAAHEALLAKYPKNNRLRWMRYCALDGLSRRADRRALIAELARSDEAEPLFWREFAIDLQPDARQIPAARRWLMRALRYQPTDADSLHAMAGVLWDEQRRPEALALYRLAATAREKVEHLQRSWFMAARHLRMESEVLSVLQERARREAKRSSQPALTLYWALTSVGREHDALVELDRAVAARPEDGSLLCFAADAFARHGQAERGAELLAQAEKRSARLEWLVSAGRIADYRPDPAEALRFYRLAAAEDPMNLNLHETVARLLAETQGRPKALEYLEGQIAAFPHHIGFREAFIRWTRNRSAEACEAPLRELIELAPENVWAIRELALVLADLGRAEEALEFCHRAVALAPHEASSRGILANVLLRAGHREEAAEAARASLRLSIDYTSAFDVLLEGAIPFAEKQAGLDFILAELKRQTVFGDGLLEYLRHAYRILDPQVLLENLRGAHEARPDLWHAWSALITHLCDMQRAVEALPIAQQAVERFPLLPRVWVDLARVRRERREFAEEVEALQRGVELSPAWGVVRRSLAFALQRVDRYDDAQITLEEAIAAAPLEAANYLDLANLLWRRNRSPRAVELLSQCIRLEPDFIEAWNTLRSIQPPDSDTAVALARSLTETRAGETAPWLRLAEMLPDRALDERLAAIARALALDPRLSEAWDLRAWLLSDAGRYEEALAACDPPPFAGKPPRELRGRAAWIVARRGNLRQGRDMLREVVAAEPDYYWAWEQIALISDLLKDHKTEREAAEKMSRLNPRSAIPLGYLADAMLKLNDRDGAVQVLRRAFALDPSYGYAGFSIFEEELRKEEFDKAAETLCKLQQHLPGPDATAASIALLVAQREKAKALAAFEKVIFVPERESRAIHAAIDPLIQAGWAVDVEKLIWTNREKPDLNPIAAARWVRSFMLRESWGHCRKVGDLSPHTPFGAAAIRELANMSGESKRVDILRALLGKHREWLQQDPEGWGNVGYAWVRGNRPRDAIKWFGDWSKREGLQPWMLYNIAVTLEEQGREADAIAANRLALTLPRDHTSALHLTRLSAFDALSGDMESAQRRLQEVDYQSLEAQQKAESAMVRLLADIHATPPDRRRGMLDYERRQFYSDHPIVHSEPKLKRILPRFEQAIADAAGAKRARPIRAKAARGHTSRGEPGFNWQIVWIIFVVLIAFARCSNR